MTVQLLKEILNEIPNNHNYNDCEIRIECSDMNNYDLKDISFSLLEPSVTFKAV